MCHKRHTNIFYLVLQGIPVENFHLVQVIREHLWQSYLWAVASSECGQQFHINVSEALQISKRNKIQCPSHNLPFEISSSFSILWWHNLVLSFLRWKSRNYPWYFLFLLPAINQLTYFLMYFFNWSINILVSGVQHSGLTFMYIANWSPQ